MIHQLLVLLLVHGDTITTTTCTTTTIIVAATELTTDGDDNTTTTTTVKGTATDDDSTLINADTIKPIGGTGESIYTVCFKNSRQCHFICPYIHVVSRQHYDHWMFVVIIPVLAAVFAVILSYCIHCK